MVSDDVALRSQVAAMTPFARASARSRESNGALAAEVVAVDVGGRR